MDAGGGGALLGQEECHEAMNAMVVDQREHRRGNWTVPETMVLIEAKKRVHEGRRAAADQGMARWRWVEDFCWRRGCRRSQNQCNDRWDNLMRDYKKVRAHDLAAAAGGGEGRESYWAMCRAERKERGLPANLLREIYDAMGEIVERRMSSGGGGGGGGGVFLGSSPSSAAAAAAAVQASPLAQLLPRPLETTTAAAANCRSGSPERKRRRPSLDNERQQQPASGRHHQQQEHHDDGEYDHHGDEDEESSEEEGLGGAMGRCAAILSVALEKREAAEERRHREVVAVEERRGRARQARREAGEQCVAGLAAAVSQLAGSMLALAAKRRGPASPK